MRAGTLPLCLLLCALLAFAKRSGKEWEEMVSHEKLREQLQAEDAAAKESLGIDFHAEKVRPACACRATRPADPRACQPGMVFATFAPALSQPEMAEATRKFQGMLQSGAIRTSVFASGANQWCITTYRTNDAWTVGCSPRARGAASRAPRLLRRRR
jgi:hypothetical protein